MLTTLAKFTESTSSNVSQTVHQSTAGASFGTQVTNHGDVQLFGHAVAHSVAHGSSHVSPSLSLSPSHTATRRPHPYLICSLTPQSPPYFLFPLKVASSE